MFEFIVSSQVALDRAALAIAASRAGAVGIVDLQFTSDHAAALVELARVSALGRGRWGAHIDDESLLSALLAADLSGLDTVVVSSGDLGRLGRLVEQVRQAELRAFAVATGLEEASAAHAAGADAVIAKGHEAGGWVGEQGSFVLLQRLVAALPLPVWVHGGIGLHTVAAAYAAGAAGAVLDAQVLLARESTLSDDVRSAIASMDGSETATFGADLGALVRVYARPGLQPLAQLAAEEVRLATTPDSQSAWRSGVKAQVETGSLHQGLLPLGQDAAFAADLARRFGTVAGIIAALHHAIEEACEALGRSHPLAEGGALAESHGTRYPIVQGPMTRVSDKAEFAAGVSDAGALPFLALALMRAAEADTLLRRARELNGDRPWGVGVLGFVPPELRAEQLDVVRAHRPPFALIAGGRPSQAKELEDEGITTYLHVPSPGLLKLYLADGARRFVFEGRECGGHVGPRTSFVLWDVMLRVLLEELGPADRGCHVLFAGGVHDARSAAMVAAMAATATERGIRAGVLLGTAYLFTREATEHGAITPTFQQAAIGCTETVLLESGPGHATRCLPSPFVEQFETEKRRLRSEGLASEELRGRLEQLNIGRLRVASKGVDRAPGLRAGADAPKLAPVDVDEQWERGMYMIGEVASMHEEVITAAELHHDVSVGSRELLAAMTKPPPAPSRRSRPAPPPADVAVVGLGCILPGAPDVRTFWANILGKVDAIGEIPAERWDWQRMYDPDPATADKVYSRWGGFIDPVAFDPIALGLPPRSLASIEPFQLLALITAQAALQDAGYATRPFERERTSVILGAGGGGADLTVGYTVRSALPQLLDNPELEQQLNQQLPEWTEDSFPGLLMNVAAGRVANRLDFGGTNYTVDAACASSLTAITLGTRELQAGTSEMVLAGGVDAIQNPFAFLCFSKTRALSPRGRCRPFDATADGIAISEGFATLVLKRLADAERDGDRIYAVIRGVGAASDGRDRSLTAPRAEGQMRALRRAYEQAAFSPATVELVEAHGTGTVAGDGAEVLALSTVLAEHGAGRKSCAVGSVKSMIGHTKATAGVAGMIKASLALHHRVLPPTIGVTEPNPRVNVDDSALYVNTEARPWLTGGASHPRRAGVSAFGFGGTDFHIVLEEYTGGYLADGDATVDRWPAELLRWRGSKEEIAGSVAALANALARGEQPRLDDLALRLARDADRAATVGTDGSALALVVESDEDLRAKLEFARELLAGEITRLHRRDGVHWAHRPLAGDGAVAFLFPGQGSQTIDMARELVIAFAEARDCFELADRVLADRFEQPLSRFVFPPPGFSPEEKQRRQHALTDTHVAQAALGATELAYLHVLTALGVQPDMTAGHSYGELMALTAAGGLTDEQLLLLSEARGRFMRDAAAGETGAMVAVDAAPDRLGPLLRDGGVVAANLNAPEQTVLSGPHERVQAVLQWCRENDVGARALPVACAFHSPHVADARQRFAEALQAVSITPPRIPVYSNTTGQAHARQPGEIAEALGQHLVKPVEFVREIETMYRDGARVFLEVGPRSVLTGLVKQILGAREHVAIACDQSGRSGLLAFTHSLAALAVEGVPLRTDRLFRGRSAARSEADRRARGDRSTAPSPGRWLVNGGRSWPADGAPASSPSPPAAAAPALPSSKQNPTPLREERAPVSTISTNGAGTLVPVAASPAPPPAATPPAPATSGGFAASDRAADVMGGYQHLMQRFLETQRDVMLGYLGTPRSVAAPRPAPSTSPVTATIPAAALPAAPPPMEPPLVVPATVTPAPATSSPGPASPESLGPAVLAPQKPEPEPTPPEAAGDGDVALTSDQIQERLLVVVSDRTGYPADMLSLDGDLEGDLGIDSIKRVEIAGTFTQALRASERASIDMEALVGSRTLREVITVIEAGLAAAAQPAAATGPPGEPVPMLANGDDRPFSSGPAETERIGRFVVQSCRAPAIAPAGRLTSPGAVVIVDDESRLGAALADALVDQGRSVRLLPWPTQLADPDDAAALADELRDGSGGVTALVYLAAATDRDGGLRTLFWLAQALAKDLDAAARAGGAAMLGVTRLGGAFGFDGGARDGTEGHGAVAGFLKTLAIEWPAVRVKVVDLPEGPLAEGAQQLLLDELGAADGLVEVGYRNGERTRLTLVSSQLDDPEAEPAIDETSVLLLTGGARGITAEVAMELAVAHRPRLVLVGRTPREAEPPGTAALTDRADLRSAMIEARRSAGADLTPALVEADCRRVLRGRELEANLARLRATGAGVDYRECDVSDPDGFAALIDQIYEQYGRIDGVVHGAGVIEDRLIVDKQPDSLERVMATKAGAARTLAQKLRPQTLGFLALFSSVSGRFGNRGQADYAAASEVLNKLAHELDRRWSARVVSLNWGPWRSAGMVSTALEQEFERRGVTLIGVQQGCRMLMAELAGGRKGDAEVVIGAATGLSGPAPDPDAADLPLLRGATQITLTGGGGLEAVRRIAVAHDRYLDDHRVDGRPVLPFAVAMELMAEVGAVAASGPSVAGLRDIRLFNGVTVPDSESVRVRITATPDAAGEELDVVIGAADGRLPHYRAVVDLRGRGSGLRDRRPEVLPELRPFPMPVADAYRELLFHGPLFHGIVSIAGMDERGATSLLAPSQPERCVAVAGGLHWLLDPVMLDSALQVQVLWARLEWDVTVLPVEIAGYATFSPPREGELVRHEMRLGSETSAPMCRADHWFFGADERLIGTLSDVVGFGTKALNRLATVAQP